MYVITDLLDYFVSTFDIDPSSFLAPLADRLQKGETIQDIGCGSGRDLHWLQPVSNVSLFWL
jgi:hypothetical protein